LFDVFEKDMQGYFMKYQAALFRLDQRPKRR